MSHTQQLTFKQAQAAIRALGLTIKRTYGREFRVNLPNGTEATAYYTDDLQDAVGTAQAMAKHQEQRQQAIIGGCKLGELVTFFTKGEERSVTGRVVELHFGASQGDYHTVGVEVDGMMYYFGTGGHLGDTWTAESGAEQWFKV